MCINNDLNEIRPFTIEKQIKRNSAINALFLTSRKIRSTIDHLFLKPAPVQTHVLTHANDVRYTTRASKENENKHF